MSESFDDAWEKAERSMLKSRQSLEQLLQMIHEMGEEAEECNVHAYYERLDERCKDLLRAPYSEENSTQVTDINKGILLINDPDIPKWYLFKAHMCLGYDDPAHRLEAARLFNEFKADLPEYEAECYETMIGGNLLDTTDPRFRKKWAEFHNQAGGYEEDSGAWVTEEEIDGGESGADGDSNEAKNGHGGKGKKAKGSGNSKSGKA